jgi:hypothetical protein
VADLPGPVIAQHGHAAGFTLGGVVGVAGAVLSARLWSHTAGASEKLGPL